MFSKQPVEIRTAPHLKRPQTVDQIMRNVVYALLPVAAFAVYQFGISALALIVTTTLVSMLTERLFSQLSGKGNTLRDWSVVITGLLLALTLLTMLGSIRLTLYPTTSLWDLSWVGSAFGSVFNYTEGWRPELAMIIANAFLWWRVAMNSGRDLTFLSVGVSFRLGMATNGPLAP